MSAFLALSLLSAWAGTSALDTTVTLTATDDVWAYPHAGDPTSDPFLRVWGSEGESVGPSDLFEGTWSYSFARFDLSSVPAKGSLKSAKLVLMVAYNDSLSVEDAKRFPIEARLAGSDFREKGWVFEDVAKVAPKKGKEFLLGSNFPASWTEGKPTRVEIDLLKGEGGFEKSLWQAVASSKSLALALTSSISPGDLGRSAVYRIHSRNGDAELAPKLVLTVAPG